jgi:putative Holliday junction resolvase
VSGRTRLLGIDYGSKRIGLAVSDPDRKIASPLTTYKRADRDADARYFQQVIEAEQIGQLVVGLPIHLSGDESAKSVEARAFGKWLHKLTGLPVVFADERFSTVEAESALWNAGLTHKKRKARRDRLAAQILLQGYLEAGCPMDVPSLIDRGDLGQS